MIQIYRETMEMVHIGMEMKSKLPFFLVHFHFHYIIPSLLFFTQFKTHYTALFQGFRHPLCPMFKHLDFKWNITSTANTIFGYNLTYLLLGHTSNSNWNYSLGQIYETIMHKIHVLNLRFNLQFQICYWSSSALPERAPYSKFSSALP